MSRIGIKKKLTAPMREILLETLAQGVSLHGALNKIGITPERFQTIISGEGKEALVLKAQCDSAQARAEETLCRRIIENSSPAVALAFLQTRFKHWATKSDNPQQDQKAEALLARLASVPEQQRKRN